MTPESPPSPPSSLTSPRSQVCSPTKILSSPPTSLISPSLDYLPPPSPLPWAWTCHRCTSRYNIAITRRCLSCGHNFCLWYIRRHGNRPIDVHEANVCAVEFDYLGWKAWMDWRRDTGHLQKQNAGANSLARGNEMTSLSPDGHVTRDGKERCERKHDCSVDCDYPSQCLHERYLALRELAVTREGMEGGEIEDLNDEVAIDTDMN